VAIVVVGDFGAAVVVGDFGAVVVVGDFGGATSTFASPVKTVMHGIIASDHHSSCSSNTASLSQLKMKANIS